MGERDIHRIWAGLRGECLCVGLNPHAVYIQSQSQRQAISFATLLSTKDEWMRTLYSFVFESGRKSYTVPDSYRHIVPILFSGPRFWWRLKKISSPSHWSLSALSYICFWSYTDPFLADENSILPSSKWSKTYAVKKRVELSFYLVVYPPFDHPSRSLVLLICASMD